MLKTYLPDSEGPRSVGAVLAMMVVVFIFLLWATPLREMTVWHRLLFTVPTPISTYFAISLLAMSDAKAD